MIDQSNHASQNVCRKLEFAFLKQAFVDWDKANFYTLTVGDAVR